MDLLAHITIALSSVAIATAAFLAPTVNRLKISYVFIALTLVTGTYLVAVHPGHLVQSCISGLVYVAAMTATTALAHNKLARQESANTVER